MDEEDLVPISALQHYLYCPRQCALIHVECQWQESRQTAEGRLLHERTDIPHSERRHGMRTVTSMPIADAELGIAGVSDVIEFHPGEVGERPYPVEFKRGRPKRHRADEVQLCAQALCLEGMFGIDVREGAIFYAATRRRKRIAFDDDLRRLTRDVIRATRDMIAAGRTPLAVYKADRCRFCSLIEVCGPHLLERAGGVDTWLRGQIKAEV